MVEILISPGQRELREAVLQAVCRSEAEGQLLLVPEQASHELERALCAAGGDGVCLRAEVLSFSRLAARVFSLYGGVSRKTLDNGGRLIAMARAMEAVGSRLKLYGACRRRSDFLLRMLRMIDELRAARIAPGRLRAAAGEAGGQLAVKLEELSLILESYEAVCGRMGQDPNHRLSRLAELLHEEDFAAGRRIFLLGFTDFTGQELAVLDALLERAASLTAALPDDGSGRGPFALAAGAARTLKRMARERGHAVQVTRLPDAPLPAELLHLRRHALSGAPVPAAGGASAIRLHHSDGPQSACLDAAGLIQELVLEHGWRYRDIAVCCTDPDVYAPVLESVFGRLSIPLYRAGAEPIRNDPVAGMLLAALEAAAGGMETDDVLRFLKSGLSPLRQEETDRLENYVRTWRIHGGQWGETWDMPPGGFGEAADDRTGERLDALNEARRRGAGPLLKLCEALKRASVTAEQVRALYEFLIDVRLAETLEDAARRCEDDAELRRAQAYGQMYETILEALEQLGRVLGGESRSPEDFADMTAAVLSRYTVGTIPASLDDVAAGGPLEMRLTRCRAMLVLGAEDGTLPAFRPETGLLTEDERRRLLAMGVAVSPGQSDELDRELTALQQLLSAPSELLYVNTCTDAPAYLFERIRALFPALAVEEDRPVPLALTYAAGPLAEFLAGRPVMLPEALRERAGAVRDRAAHRLGRLDKAAVEGLYGKTLHLSASRIDQYAACRCAYFLNYGLRLRALREAGFDAPAYGTYVHAILERTGRRVMEEGGFRQVTEPRLEAIASEEMDGYRDDALQAMLARSERFAYLFRRRREEVLAVVRELGRELRRSAFVPAEFELEFSSGGPLPPVQIRGLRSAAELTGFVDRVDLYRSGGKTYVRVVDYKTGRKSFDYTDILCGMGMQMLLYLFTLEQNGEAVFQTALRPAGVLYVPARQGILTAPVRLGRTAAEELRRKEQLRKGLVLSEDSIPAAMEAYERAPVYMPFQPDREGNLKGDLAGSGDFQLLRRHVERTVSRMADDIAGGAVEPNPIVRGTEYSPCLWCEYARICHRASGEVRLRPIKAVGREEFWERLEEEEKRKGGAGSWQS